MKISNEVRVGIIVTVAIAVTIWGLNFLKGRNILKPANEYLVIYNDIGGLDVNSKIFLNGYRVGEVSDVYFNKDRTGKLTVVLGIHKAFKIPENSVAELFSSDLMGTKAVRILMSESDSYHEPGDTLSAGFSPGIEQQIQEQILPLKDKAEQLMVSVDSVLQNLSYIFDQNTAQSLKHSVRNLEEGIESMNEILAPKSKLRSFIAHIESISENLDANNEMIAHAIKNISAISDSLANSELKSTISRANETLEETHILLQKINNGEGTIGMLVNNDTLYHNLESVSRDLDILLIDLKENPKKYINVSVFGKSDKKNK